MCVEYLEDAYQQAERLMLERKAASSDIDDRLTISSGTLAKLSPPTKHAGLRHLTVVLIQFFVLEILVNFVQFLPRDARIAKRGIAIVSRPSVCPSLCL